MVARGRGRGAARGARGGPARGTTRPTRGAARGRGRGRGGRSSSSVVDRRPRSPSPPRAGIARGVDRTKPDWLSRTEGVNDLEDGEDQMGIARGIESTKPAWLRDTGGTSPLSHLTLLLLLALLR